MVGAAAVVSWYWVVKLPVIVMAVAPTVTLCEIAPASDQFANTPRVPAPNDCGVVVASV